MEQFLGRTRRRFLGDATKGGALFLFSHVPGTPKAREEWEDFSIEACWSTLCELQAELLACKQPFPQRFDDAQHYINQVEGWIEATSLSTPDAQRLWAHCERLRLNVGTTLPMARGFEYLEQVTQRVLAIWSTPTIRDYIRIADVGLTYINLEHQYAEYCAAKERRTRTRNMLRRAEHIIEMLAIKCLPHVHGDQQKLAQILLFQAAYWRYRILANDLGADASTVQSLFEDLRRLATEEAPYPLVSLEFQREEAAYAIRVLHDAPKALHILSRGLETFDALPDPPYIARQSMIRPYINLQSPTAEEEAKRYRQFTFEKFPNAYSFARVNDFAQNLSLPKARILLVGGKMCIAPQLSFLLMEPMLANRF